MNTLLRSSLAALLLAPAVADAQAPAAWSDFTRLFQAYVDSDRVVGASVALIKNGHVVSRLNTGFADRTANVRTDDQTIYHSGAVGADRRDLTARHAHVPADSRVCAHRPRSRAAAADRGNRRCGTSAEGAQPSNVR